MDYQTRQGLIVAATVMLGPVFMWALRRYRPTKFAHDFLWKRIKNERLRKFLFSDF
jgi:hypothetical protein